MRDLVGAVFLLAGIMCLVVAGFGASAVPPPAMIAIGLAFVLVGYQIMYRRR